MEDQAFSPSYDLASHPPLFVGRTPLWVNTFPPGKQYAVQSRGRKVNPCFNLKVNFLWDMADSISYLVPTHLQESVFLPITRPDIPAQSCLIGQRQ